MRWVEGLNSVLAWLDAPLWPPARRRYWTARRRSDGLRDIGHASLATVSDLRAALRDRRPSPQASVTRASDRLRQDAADAADRDLAALASEWGRAATEVMRRWTVPDDAQAAIDDLAAISGRIASRVAALLGAEIRAASDVVRSYPLRSMTLDGVPVSGVAGRLERYRYRSILLWRVAGVAAEGLLDSEPATRVAAVHVIGDGDVAVAGRGIVTVNRGPVSTDLSIDFDSHARATYSGPEKARLQRGRIVLWSLFAPAVLGLFVTLLGQWRYVAALEAGAVATLGLMGLSLVVLAVRRVVSGTPFLQFVRRDTFVGRHPSLLLIGAAIFAVVGAVWAGQDVADWLSPPDRLEVSIAGWHDNWRGGNTEIWTTEPQVTYYAPLFIRIRVHPGPAVIYLGHVSHRLLWVEQDGNPPPTPTPVVTPAPVSAALPSTPAVAQVLETPPPGGVFYVPGPASALWYRVGTEVRVALTGLDGTDGGGYCVLTALAVGNDEKYLSASPTRTGACGSTGTLGPALVCTDMVLVPTTIPAGQQGTLFVEIHTSSDAVFGVATTPAPPGDLPQLNPSSLGCP